MDAQRLIELEERIAHLEAGLESVTDALLARERELRDAWLAIERLKSQVAELAPPATGDAAQEPPPPHY
ncbi:MAG: SlyX family protein [Acidihalobacter sp.]|jgi:SlyX protein